jgi:hypothetical protein
MRVVFGERNVLLTIIIIVWRIVYNSSNNILRLFKLQQFKANLENVLIAGGGGG